VKSPSFTARFFLALPGRLLALQGSDERAMLTEGHPDVTDFAKRLHQIVGGLAVVFDDQEAHMEVGCGQGGRAFYHHGAVDILMQGDPAPLDQAKKSGR